jgi:regulatory protein
MDVITSIRRERGKFRVTINGSEDVLVPLALFRERPLNEGEPIDLASYDQWLMVRQYRFALDRAVAALAARACSRKEISDKLTRIGYRPCTVEMVLYKLEREHLLNDEDFAQQWADARSRHGLGRQRIAQELRQKGIDSEQIETVLSSIDEDEQLESATALAEKALRRAKKDEEPRKTTARVMAMLARKGYGYSVAREAVERAKTKLETE